MAKFVEGNELNHQLETLFKTAEERLILISPYIKLHERFISVLKTKMTDPKFKIIVVFGKNENDLSKSMKIEDFNFFKEFRNIEIRYEKRLHAKYYANESVAILASMNLYNFSQNNNIEAGIVLSRSILSMMSEMVNDDGIEIKAAEYFKRVIDQSTVLFKRSPEFESTLLGLSKRYTSTRIEVDELSSHFTTKQISPDVTSQEKNNSIVHNDNNNLLLQKGFCIRTRKSIPFNIYKPMCDQALASWSKYKDENYKENYCHFSGEDSNGQTTFKKPVLSKNYKKAQEIFKFF